MLKSARLKKIHRTIKITRKVNKSRKTNKTKKASKTIASASYKLIPLTKLTPTQAEQLAIITSNPNTMKHIGMGRLWSLNDIKTYIAEEKLESRKPEYKKSYYTFILIDHNNQVVGYISGRKSMGIGASRDGKFDLLLRVFINPMQTGHGLGKLILALFINEYTNIIRKLDISARIKLYSDISQDNIASIKIHQKNKFQFLKEITYSGNPNTFKRMIRIINI
jgi:hypothetical protein